MNFNDTYMKFIEPNVETGNQYNAPVDLDIRPGNLCNLKMSYVWSRIKFTIRKRNNR